MRTRRLQCFTLAVCLAVPSTVAHAQRAARRVVNSAATRQVAAKEKHRRTPRTRNGWRKRGQQAIQPKRVRQIQAALIREGYLQGRPNGIWDERSKHAMGRFQADNQWQSTVVPDARALIKLGLGPDRAALINPETAAISFALGQNTQTSAAPLQR